MTDEGIHQEFYIHQELDRRVEEQRKTLIPHCPTEGGCGYEGPPHPGSDFCPRCGAEMTIPGKESDQTTYVDDDFDQTVKDELGIDLPDSLK